MALSSMTGFARSHGASGTYSWSWELKSVNAKGLELRFRLPSGFDAVEVAARARAAERLSRGNVYANLTVTREGVTPVVRVNEQVLEALVTTLRNLSSRVDAEKPRLDGVLGLKGVIDVIDEEDSEVARDAAQAVIIESFTQALAGLGEMRRHEGEAIGRLLSARLDEIAALAASARRPHPGVSRTRSRSGSPNRSRRSWKPPRGSMPTGCIRRRSCSPARPTCARRSTASPRTLRKPAS